ncbi:tonB-system energizer ExbB [Nitrobacter vulgaris]|uniref:tonB-system energizer ExbB n=1 Tax=Nitrobacter vulgaris TaxID=29421 RepID=UPI0035B53B42
MTGFVTRAIRLGFVVALAVLAIAAPATAQQQGEHPAAAGSGPSAHPATQPSPRPALPTQPSSSVPMSSQAASTPMQPSAQPSSASPTTPPSSVTSPTPSSSSGVPAAEASSGEAPAASSDAAAPLDQSAAPAAAPAPDASSSTLPQDLSPWGMFMQADIIVKAVMIGLAFASLVTWTIWLARGLDLAASRRRAQSCLRKLERADTLAAARAEISEGWTGKGPVSDLMEAAENECRRSNDLSSEGIKERLAIALSRIEAKSGRDIARGTGLLATIGATAPFVGLFGTVWGIMNSFIGISHSKTTNLAVVAPGIAEALLATALGLVAAIPAVIIYNVFARALSSYRALLSDASGEIIQHISRDLERQERGLGPSVVPLSRGRSAAE